MELVEQQHFPQLVDLLATDTACAVAVAVGEKLQVVEQVFGLAVVSLDQRLRRVRATVIFEIQLADLERAVGQILFDQLEEFVAGSLLECAASPADLCSGG